MGFYLLKLRKIYAFPTAMQWMSYTNYNVGSVLKHQLKDCCFLRFLNKEGGDDASVHVAFKIFPKKILKIQNGE